jgi:serine/threonine protein kinase
MYAVPGLTIVEEKTAISATTQLYLARNKSNNLVLIKRLDKITNKYAYKKSLQINKLLDKLANNHILKASHYEEDQQYYYSIHPLPNGQTLRDSIDQKSLNLHEKLTIAVNSALLLDQLHLQHIIVNNLNDEQLYISKDLQVQMVDLSLASKVSTIYKKIPDSHLERQWLPTMSPEFSGRMNRAVDKQADLYSLGATLFKLFTGRYPFEYDDDMEMVHAHIAKVPHLAHHFNSQLPEQISIILAKLLKKNPEQRYKTAEGLAEDFKRCRSDLESKNVIDNFLIGQRDTSQKLTFSSELFGRQKELESLNNSYQTVRGQHNSRLAIVSGYSGVGKSRLIKELNPIVSQNNDYFVTGKFEQYKNNTTYIALFKALNNLVEQLLGESNEKLKQWCKYFNDELGQDAQLLIDLIPNLELIIGKQKKSRKSPSNRGAIKI